MIHSPRTQRRRSHPRPGHTQRRLARAHPQRVWRVFVAAAEHGTPERALAYLITDQVVADTPERFAELRPPLDQVSQRAIDQDHSSERITATPDVGTVTPGAAGTSPDAMLWAALSLAADEGTTVPEPMGLLPAAYPPATQHQNRQVPPHHQRATSRVHRLHRRPRRGMRSEQLTELVRRHADDGQDVPQGSLGHVLAHVNR
jgi:hypothetical protein